jgi:class 3 adenylate cyclase
MSLFKEVKDVFFREDSTQEGRMPLSIEEIIKTELQHFSKSVSITKSNKIPDTHKVPIQKAPIQNPTTWLKVPDVICCFVDMEGSTKLSARLHDKTTAKSYRLFTETAIRIFHNFGAAYIDVKGDGVFSLFNSNQPYSALAATVSFKTFVYEHFTPKVKNLTDQEVGGHFGIDQKTVLVRKFGLKTYQNRTDRQNEVWAGKPINMAAKLASLSTDNRLWISERFFGNLKDERATHSCGCPNDEKVELWKKEDISGDNRFDFNTAYSLGSNWCERHGKSFCSSLIKLDDLN